MSETEHRIGKLIPVEMKENLEITAQHVLSEMMEEKKDYYDSCLDQLDDVGYKKYVILNDKIYKVDMVSIDQDDDIFKASENDDGTIDFEVKYYNGGCSFDEAIERAIKGI